MISYGLLLKKAVAIYAAAIFSNAHAEELLVIEQDVEHLGNLRGSGKVFVKCNGQKLDATLGNVQKTNEKCPSKGEPRWAGDSFTDEIRAQAQGQQEQESQQQATRSEGGSSDVDKIRAQADQIIGKYLVDQDGNQIGELTDLIVHPDQGNVYAVLSVGGFLGIGDKQVALPFNRLQFVGHNVSLMSQKDEASLGNLPDYDERHWLSLDEEM